MATKAAIEPARTGVVEAQFARVANEGSARHPQLTALLAASGPNAARDLADLVERGLLLKIGEKRGAYYILK
jgi:predicted HTH transcriptional regulator